uniref:Ribbon-helix-helix protein, CopG family n=1 Tax=Schlesneria paludicola TaxID=360056 RepID=A0A7C2JZH2_9PLAN
MPSAKIAITIDESLLARIDQLVEERRFPSRSRAVQEALRDKLDRMQRTRLARECSKLSRAEEQCWADEGLAEDLGTWPAY